MRRVVTRRAAATAAPQPRAVPELAFDPLAPGYFDDPYPQYEALRAHHPVYFEPQANAYIVTRYHDVHRLVRDRSMLVEIHRATPTPRIMAEVARNAAVDAGPDKWMVFRDGDDHTRLRRLVAQVFTPKAIATWRERTEVILDHLLREAEDHEPFDVITRLARPLPAQIISEMLGVPPVDMPQMLAWSHALIRTIEAVNTPEEEVAVIEANRAMVAYLEALIDEKRDRPGDDILTALMAAGDADDRLAPDEIVAQIVVLYFAGHETTENLIGNGLVHLFANPGELERLRADRTLAGPGIEELLRFDAPVQFTRRIAVSPFELHGVAIPAGADVLLGLGSANRDRWKWGDDADVLDLARPNAADHMSFSGGAHYCLGASLARLEGRIALPTLLRRFPRLAPAYAEPAWAPRMVVRGVNNLPVHLHGA
jgi:cytochrome P450